MSRILPILPLAVFSLLAALGGCKSKNSAKDTVNSAHSSSSAALSEPQTSSSASSEPVSSPIPSGTLLQWRDDAQQWMDDNVNQSYFFAVGECSYWGQFRALTDRETPCDGGFGYRRVHYGLVREGAALSSWVESFGEGPPDSNSLAERSREVLAITPIDFGYYFSEAENYLEYPYIQIEKGQKSYPELRYNENYLGNDSEVVLNVVWLRYLPNEIDLLNAQTLLWTQNQPESYQYDIVIDCLCELQGEYHVTVAERQITSVIAQDTLENMDIDSWDIPVDLSAIMALASKELESMSSYVDINYSSDHGFINRFQWNFGDGEEYFNLYISDFQ